MGPTRRLTFLERRTDATPERFSWHWSTDHADIARRLPGMTVYEQNHAVRQLLPVTAGDSSFTVDGIAESWYESAASIVAGVDSAAKRELLIDEPLVFSGLTGIIVPPYDGPRSPAWKIWLLGSDGFQPDEVTGGLLGVAFAHTAARSEAVPTMTRDALRRKAKVPDAVTELHFDTAECAHRAADSLEERLSTDAPEHLLDALLTREVRIL
jgi:uncharacterized protein (TIGR02118 family)